MLAGSMSSLSIAAVKEASEGVRLYLQRYLGEFDWRTNVVRRREATLRLPADPMVLVDLAAFERDAAHWDFAFVVTDSPLRASHRPFMLGAPAQALDVAVLSTAQLDPGASSDMLSEEERRRVLTERLQALALHLFGHLNDLPHSPEPNDMMAHPRRVVDLDRIPTLTRTALSRLRLRLAQVADPRVEELGEVDQLRFVLQALWRNRAECVSGVKRVAPWLFPLRYSRLTTAAISAQVLLLITAEAWELGMSQPLLRVACLSLGALLLASYYVVQRQHLLRSVGERLSEQNVVAISAMSVGVLLGMGLTYLLLWLTTWLAAVSLFGDSLVRNWAASLKDIHASHYLSLSSFVATIGLITGALGASFEEESYFRRVAILDEET